MSNLFWDLCHDTPLVFYAEKKKKMKIRSVCAQQKNPDAI
jgi:hypothetical protein